MAQDIAISAVIPAYREALAIENAIASVTDALDAIGENHEIIVVDNASVDRTADIARSTGYPVRVLENKRNFGKGYSVRRGMLAARGKWRFFCDADLSTPVSEIPRFWELAQSGPEVLVGSRLASGAHVVEMQPIKRRLAGRVMLTVSHALFGRMPDDIFCGFKWFSAPAADELFANSRANGWAFDLELLALANQLGISYEEIPIEWTNHEDTRLDMSRDWAAIGIELLRIRWNLRRSATRVVLSTPEAV